MIDGEKLSPEATKLFFDDNNEYLSSIVEEEFTMIWANECRTREHKDIISEREDCQKREKEMAAQQELLAKARKELDGAIERQNKFIKHKKERPLRAPFLACEFFYFLLFCSLHP